MVDDSKKYYVQKAGKWTAVDRDEANRIMGIKAKKHEASKATEGKTRVLHTPAGDSDRPEGSTG